jgi:hypothetical protein
MKWNGKSIKKSVVKVSKEERKVSKGIDIDIEIEIVLVLVIVIVLEFKPKKDESVKALMPKAYKEK